MPNRSYTAGMQFRYGFNGKEKDDEVVQYDYGFRIYDPRISRFKSIDPLTISYPWYTPYQFAGNTPIQAIDIDGKEGETYLEVTEIDGKEVVLRRVIEVDIYIKVSDQRSSTDFKVKNFSIAALNNFAQQFRNDLAEHYKDGKFKDTDGYPIVFKFNVIPFGGNNKATQEFISFLKNEEVGVLKDNEGFELGTRTVVVEQSKMNELTIPKGEDILMPPIELGEFVDPSTIRINDQQFDRTDANFSKAHEIAHFFLSKHPDPSIRYMGNSAEKHDKAGKGILHYYPVSVTNIESQINPSQNNRTTLEFPGRESVNQANVLEFLRSIIDTGKRQVSTSLTATSTQPAKQ